MKIASVFFDDIVVIPGAKDGGSAVPPQDLRESSFHARDGWAIAMEPHGVFRLFREPMKGPCTVGGYGFTFIPGDSSDGRAAPVQGRVAGSTPVPGTISEESLGNVEVPAERLIAAAGKRRRK